MLTPPPPPSPSRHTHATNHTDRHSDRQAWLSLNLHHTNAHPPLLLFFTRKVCCERWHVLVNFWLPLCLSRPLADSSVKSGDGEPRCLGEAVQLGDQGEEVDTMHCRGVTDAKQVRWSHPEHNLPLCWTQKPAFGLFSLRLHCDMAFSCIFM